MIRKLILLAFLLGVAQSAHGQGRVRLCPASATMNGGNNAGTTVTCIFASNGAGNMALIWGMVDQNSAALTIADTTGNTYTTLLADSSCGNGACTVHVWAAYNIGVSAGNNTVTMTSSISAANSIYVGGQEYSGLATVSALDQITSTLVTSATPSSGNVTTTVANEVFVGIAAGGDGAVTLSAGTNIAWVMQQKTISGNRSPGWQDFLANTTQTVS